MYKSLPKPTVLPPDGAQIIRSGDEIHRYALLAQLVERAAVNRVVVGSSPTQGVLPGWRNWQTQGT